MAIRAGNGHSQKFNDFASKENGVSWLKDSFKESEIEKHHDFFFSYCNVDVIHYFDYVEIVIYLR